MDAEDLRASIPALERCTYFNTGASGPSPRPVVDAATDFLERHAVETPCAGDPYDHAWSTVDAARETVASHVGAAADEVAFTRSTADGINLIAGAIDWQPGDVVVRTDLEHPAGTLPWERLADVRDVGVRVVETEAGRLDPDGVARVIEDVESGDGEEGTEGTDGVGGRDGGDGDAGRVRLVVLSSLAWTHGTRQPVEAVVDAAHDAGAQVLVDAVQSVGQHPVDVTEWGADFVAAAGHKWLLGTWGAGFCYVDRDAVDALVPRRIGYRSVRDPGDDEGYRFRAGAPRLEVGTTAPAPYAALATAVETIEAVGVEQVEARICRLAGRLADGLGDRLLSPREPESGLVTFAADDPAATVERLRDEGFVVRALPDPRAVRASVHAFNTAAEVDRLLEHLG